MRTWLVAIVLLAAVACAHHPPTPPLEGKCASSSNAESAALALLARMGLSAEHELEERRALEFGEQSWLITIPKRADTKPADSFITVRKSDCEATRISKVTLRRAGVSSEAWPLPGLASRAATWRSARD